MKKEKFLISLLAFVLCVSFCDSASISAEIEDKNANEAAVAAVNPDEQIAQPYIWPGFPFFPGVNMPPSFPAWMTERRPTLAPIANLPEIRLPIRLPWPQFESDTESESESDSEEDDYEECPDEGIKFISYPGDCEKYILCSDGDKVAFLTCPDGLHFSRDERACKDPDDAGCE